mmetsp:Transcript_13677/g.36616  ORF Transcript_13677/g.36616 Transcript_13677/m.36616 type:complete len:170 (+) Transcript_13677:47-556(+)
MAVAGESCVGGPEVSTDGSTDEERWARMLATQRDADQLPAARAATAFGGGSGGGDADDDLRPFVDPRVRIRTSWLATLRREPARALEAAGAVVVCSLFLVLFLYARCKTTRALSYCEPGARPARGPAERGGLVTAAGEGADNGSHETSTGDVHPSSTQPVQEASPTAAS